MISRMNFFWWIGIVEDRADPEFLGRYRVRIIGYNTGNKEALPIKDLPWAVSMLPTTTPGISGVGHNPALVEGARVIGFFADGDDMQMPVIMGCFSANPQRGPGLKEDSCDPPDPLMGFTDPLGVYPKCPPGTGYNALKEPDSSRLARGEDAELHASLINKRAMRLTDIPVAMAPDVSSVAGQKDGKIYQRTHYYEPKPRFSKMEVDGNKIKDVGEASYVPLGTKPTSDLIKKGQTSMYPYNSVLETESGHAFEVDDSPGNGRIHTYHNSGTFEEIQWDGQKITKVVGNDFSILLKDKNVYVEGRLTVNVKGDAHMYVNGDVYEEIDGDKFVTIRGDRHTKIGGNDILEVLSNQNTQINGDKGLRVSGDDSETIVGNQYHSVGKDKQTTVYGDVKYKHLKNMKVTVSDNWTNLVGGKYNLGVAGLYSVATTDTGYIVSKKKMTIESRDDELDVLSEKKMFIRTNAEQEINVAESQSTQIGVDQNIDVGTPYEPAVPEETDAEGNVTQEAAPEKPATGGNKVTTIHNGYYIHQNTEGTGFLSDVSIMSSGTQSGLLNVEDTIHAGGDVSTDAGNGPTLATHKHKEIPGSGAPADTTEPDA